MSKDTTTAAQRNGEFCKGVEGWVFDEKAKKVVYVPMDWGVCVCEPEREMVAVCMADYTIKSVGNPPMWVRMPPKVAREMARQMLECAKEIEDADKSERV